MSELVEAVQRTVRREVAQVLRQAADTIDANGGRGDPAFSFTTVPDPKPKRGHPQGVGFRHQQVLDLLKKHPEGLTARDIAQRCGMMASHGRPSTQVYGVLKRLQRDGLVEKRGKVYVASG